MKNLSEISDKQLQSISVKKQKQGNWKYNNIYNFYISEKETKLDAILNKTEFKKLILSENIKNEQDFLNSVASENPKRAIRHFLQKFFTEQKKNFNNAKDKETKLNILQVSKIIAENFGLHSPTKEFLSLNEKDIK